MATQQDIEKLKLLSIFHYVLSGMLALFSCFPFSHIVMGILLLLGDLKNNNNEAAPAVVGWVFIVMGTLFILAGWTLTICVFMAGRKLKQRENHTFCLIIGGIECVFMPFGTVLGVFTLIILSNNAIRALFESPHESPASLEPAFHG